MLKRVMNMHDPPSSRALLESGVHVDEILGAGAGVDHMRTMGVRAVEMRELGWLSEYSVHETQVCDVAGDACAGHAVAMQRLKL